MVIQEIKPKKKFTYFVGVDISRNELDFAVMEGTKLLFHREIPNELGEIGPFLFELRSVHRVTMARTLFCMENTGIYGEHLLNILSGHKAYIVVDRPIQIKNSLGFNREKSDKLDSIRIAKYAERYARELRLWKPKRLVIKKLAMLMTLRARVLKMKNITRTPLKEQRSFLDCRVSDLADALSSRSFSALEADLTEIEHTIDQLISQDARLTQLMDIILSVPSIGRITAITIIIATNEYLDIQDAKKFACYAGVAPFLRESGKFKGKSKVSQAANKKIKSLLQACAMNAVKTNPELKAYYDRKVILEGKHKMAAMNAVRNKLVLRVFACLRQNRPYQHDYVYKANNGDALIENRV